MIKVELGSYNNLCSNLASTHIACFGAGEGLHKLFAYYHGEQFLGDIGFVVDNSPKKWETTIFVGERELDIHSVDYLIEHIDEVDALIIASIYEDEIVKQLSDIDEIRNLPYYSYDEMKRCVFQYRMETAQINIIRTSDVPLIPKVIHYCWFGGNPIPEKYKEWMKSWKEYCPDYEIVEWNESNYDYTKNKYMYDAYKAGKWGFVPDYARLDIIYNHGGIYLDTDVELVQNLDEFLYQSGFAGFQPDGRVALGLGFGAKPGLEIIRQLRDEYDNYEFVDFATKKDRMQKKIKAAPTLQTEFFREKGLFFANKTDECDGLIIYPAPTLCGMIDADSTPLLGEKTYSVHHFDGSWVPSK